MSAAKEPEVTVHWRVEQWFSDLPKDQLNKLKQLHEELLKFNKSLNLIGVKTISNSDVIHFADSILASRLIAKDAAVDEIYDIGSGNGFPGLVFAILNPQTKVKLVESDTRKSEYLKHCVANLGLGSKVEVLVRRVEDLPASSIKYAMCRGFSSIAKALLLMRRQVAKGGVFYHLKSEEWASEISDIPIQLCGFWSPHLLGEYRLPVGEIRFAVVKVNKTAE